ncbi:hypothetical protein ACFXK0_26260 [Nocardia sp. NPDC059177]|uniref:hypothetical protein n=1 Tax=Nocardia sp. NPDC059177 TaxID=3346759 RepID=UPI0036C0772D
MTRVTPRYSTRRHYLTGVTVLLVAALSAASGCGPEESPGNGDGGGSYSPTTTVIAAADCFEPVMLGSENIDEKRITAKIKELPLPAGACFSAVDVLPLKDNPNEFTVYVDLRLQGSTSPDDLRPAATEIAHFIKTEDIGERTASLRVTNWGASSRLYESYLIDDNFQDHPWDGTPSHGAELAIWEIHEQA